MLGKVVNVLLNLLCQLSRGDDDESVGSLVAREGKTLFLLEAEHDDGEDKDERLAATSVSYADLKLDKFSCSD